MALYFKNEKIAGFGGMPVIMEGIDTTDATAKASDILLGKTAYINDVKITGTSTFDADTKDATATVADILSGKTAYVNGQKLVGIAQDSKAPYAWKKYEIIDEIVQTLPSTSISMGSMWSEGSITVDDFLWQAGDYVVIKNYAEETILVSAPEPTETITLVDGNTTVRHVVSGDTISFNYWNGGNLSGEISVTITRSSRKMIEYVVDDSRRAYPDGAVHTDGYWYERVDKEGLSAWEVRKLKYDNEVVFRETITGGSSTFTNNQYLWNTGDFMVFGSNAVANGIYVFESAPDPSQSCSIQINGVEYTLSYNAQRNLTITASTTDSFEFFISKSVGAGDLIKYIVDDNEGAYPEDNIYPERDYYSGKWYRKVSLEGMYCWQKSLKTIEYPTLTPTGITLTASGNGYNITSSSGNAWSTHLIHSPVLNAVGKDINIIHTITSTSYPYFIGFDSAAQTVHTALDHCVYIVNGGTIKHIASNVEAGTYGTYVAGDKIRINLKDGYFTVYKNEVKLFSVEYSLSSVVLNATFYYGGVNYGTIECSVVEETDKSYVIGNEEDAYPNDSIADDGYYYTKVGATKITPKRANGTVTQNDKLIEINGLNFKPFAAFVYCPSINNGTPGNSWGYIDENGKIYGYYTRGGSKGSSSLEVMDNGFKILASDTMGRGTYYWHALGY